MNYVEQSGPVTPAHLASWTTTGVIQDAGVTLVNTYGQFEISVTGINFNSATTDTPIAINLPAGFTRYRVSTIIISGASASLSTATCGVFTGAGGTGVAIVANASSITVTASTTDINNNMQALTIANQNTLALSDGTIFFRVVGAQGSAATANVTVHYEPLP